MEYIYYDVVSIFVLFIDHDEFESQFPNTKPEICNSSLIVHHLLEYNCLYLNLRVQVVSIFVLLL